MIQLLPFPASQGEIPLDYPVYETGDWHGPLARFVGAFAWLGLNLRRPALAIGWVLGCAAAGVLPIAVEWINPWLVFVPVLALFAYPAALRLRLDRLARNWWDNFHKAIGGNAYRAAAKAWKESTRNHEGVHVWQRANNSRHTLRYSLDPRGLDLPGLRDRVPYYRAHAEIQAYAFEVARGYRTMSEAVGSLTRPIYALGLDDDAARGLLREYVIAWRELPE